MPTSKPPRGKGLKDTPTATDIGRRIKHVMLLRGWSSVEPAERKLGMSKGHLGRIIRGDRWKEEGEISVPIARRMASLFRVTLAWLVFGEGDEPTTDTPQGRARKAGTVLGVSPEAMANVARRIKDSEVELTPDDWLDLFRAEERRLEAGKPEGK
jgi:hypothetical protein